MPVLVLIRPNFKKILILLSGLHHWLDNDSAKVSNEYINVRLPI